MDVVCVIQARIGSTRLPGKILKELPNSSKITVLENVINRVRKSIYIKNNIVLAIPDTSEDDLLVEEADRLGIMHSRGSKDNVLSRFYHATKDKGAKHVVRITSDCPCLDYQVLDRVIECHITDENDYTSNVFPRSFPHGFDVEIFKFESLKEAYEYATEQFELEHVTPYFYHTKKNEMKLGNVEGSVDNSEIRLTLDTEQDYNYLSALFSELYSENPFFSMDEIMKIHKEKPWLSKINSEVFQKQIIYTDEEVLDLVNKFIKNTDIPFTQLKSVVCGINE